MKVRKDWIRHQLCDAVEAAIRYGYTRAHKHDDAPSEEAICDAIASAVQDALDEALDYETGVEC